MSLANSSRAFVGEKGRREALLPRTDYRGVYSGWIAPENGLILLGSLR
jgi:hypothetical protein